MSRAATEAAHGSATAAAVRPVLLIGAGGMLGRAMAAALSSRGAPFAAPGRAELDLVDARSVERALRPGVELVVNCAAWTDVDGAEAHERKATEVNGAAVARLAEACERIGATLLTFGTDYVFDGRGDSPYPVGHPRSPVNAYGRSKAAGEEALEQSGAHWLHVRTSWLYAPWGKNFVRTIAKAGRERPTLRVVDDQRGRPTSAEHLAQASLALADRGARGHWHLTDGGECTWCEFAREIVRLTGGTASVEPCSSEAFPRPARRPAYSVLDLARSERLIGAMPDWRESLRATVRRLED